MTIEEKKLALIKALELKIGDLIEFKDPLKLKDESEKYIICDGDDGVFLESVLHNQALNISYLIAFNWVKVEKPKRFGDLKCKDMGCDFCPLSLLTCCDEDDKTLYDVLDFCFDTRDISKDSNIYKAFKEELDKEVVEEDDGKIN